ncbi:hypothetical protein N7G274_006329 [Stereocaulon virgatum]|uniref:WW domain-binding protein n=1 Tax=Stereocaulon virgatum TaxID=373712 RepID=A0ABR4A670_9LECA
MSINWVMLDGPQSFVRLPREKLLFISPPRTALALETPKSYPGKEPLSIKCSDGKAIITNQRLIYLPTTPTPTLQSFSAPLLNLQDTHVSAPFFGPNTWEGILIPVTGGGIPPQHTLVSLKLTFKEGGAFDFSSTFERIKENVAQAIELARESGRNVTGGGSTGVVDVDLEQLPAYEEASGQAAGGEMGGQPVGATATAQAPQLQRPTPIAPNGVQRPGPALPANNGVVGLEQQGGMDAGRSRRDDPPPPDEPPPGYEEVQQSSVADHLERRVRGES